MNDTDMKSEMIEPMASRAPLEDTLQHTANVKHHTIQPIYKKIGQWAGVALVILIVLGMLFFGGGSKKKSDNNTPTPAVMAQMQASEMQLEANMAKLKSEEAQIAPAMMANNSLGQTASDVNLYQTTAVNNDNDNSAAQNFAARENAPTKMYSANVNDNTASSTASAVSNNNQNGTFAGQDGYSTFGNQTTGYTTVSATQITHPETTIASGEFIHAVLETAIDSDLPGMVRAVISTPVYAYVGEQPLIPAGSRLIGQYSSTVMQGMTRVFVVWNRIILPNGMTVQLNSPGTDELGMAGQNADSVNTHFFAQFGEAALLSVLGAGAANVGVSPDAEDNSAAMYRQAISQSFQQSAQQSLYGTIAIKPTLKIFQGANIVVFVAHDLSFYNVLNPPNNNDD